MAKQRVLVDTCVIIEAFRINCWKSLCKHFEVETVDCCVTECCTGDPLKPGRVNIPKDELLEGLTRVHQVSDEMLLTLQLERVGLPALDDGERHMIAWLNANPLDAVLTVISTTDRAAIRAACVMRILDRVTSLQELARTSGVGKNQLKKLQDHFHESWLSSVRMQLNSGII